MKRVTVWIDYSEDHFEQTIEELKLLLSSAGLLYTVVDTCTLRGEESSK